MSIYGTHKTSLGMNGAPARGEGFNALHLMINLELPLQIAGSFTGDFCDLQTIPPSQIAQQEDGDINVVVTVLNNGVPQDMSAAHSLTILVKKPDLTTDSFSAQVATNGRDGKIYIALNPADLDQAGYYYVQASFTIASVAKHTALGSFKVSENLVPTPEED